MIISGYEMTGQKRAPQVPKDVPKAAQAHGVSSPLSSPRRPSAGAWRLDGEREAPGQPATLGRAGGPLMRSADNIALQSRLITVNHGCGLLISDVFTHYI